MKQCNNNRQSLYLMECNGQFKIGISNNPESRYKTFLTGNPNINLVCYSKPISFAMFLETKLHHLFKDKNIKGEWFTLSEENIISLVKLLTNLNEDDFDTLKDMLDKI